MLSAVKREHTATTHVSSCCFVLKRIIVLLTCHNFLPLSMMRLTDIMQIACHCLCTQCLPLPNCYMLTASSRCSADHMWWASSPGRASHPNPSAPRCLPCDFDDSKFNHSLKPFNAPKGCPCTAQLICQTDERGIFNQYCDVPKAPMSTYSMHGGAGGIISIGMLREVSLDYMEKCVKSLYSTGQSPLTFLLHMSRSCLHVTLHCL